MNNDLLRKVGSIGQDNLFAKLFPPAETFGVTIKVGEGELARGTVLVMGDDGTYTVLNTETTGKANCVLADPVDASGDSAVTGVAYRTGHFNTRALIVADGYTMTVTDKEELRKGGILLSEMMD